MTNIGNMSSQAYYLTENPIYKREVYNLLLFLYNTLGYSVYIEGNRHPFKNRPERALS